MINGTKADYPDFRYWRHRERGIPVEPGYESQRSSLHLDFVGGGNPWLGLRRQCELQAFEQQLRFGLR